MANELYALLLQTQQSEMPSWLGLFAGLGAGAILGYAYSRWQSRPHIARIADYNNDGRREMVLYDRAGKPLGCLHSHPDQNRSDEYISSMTLDKMVLDRAPKEMQHSPVGQPLEALATEQR